jgi:hypothetical protein
MELAMQTAEIEGIKAKGVAGRMTGLSFHDNQQYFMDVPVETTEQFSDWLECSAAWAAGWLEQDAGRDKAMQSMFKVRYW